MLVLHLLEYFRYWNSIAHFLQALPQPPTSPVLTSLKMSVELWVSLWTGHWVVETVLISTSSTLPPMVPSPHMGDFWTSLAVSHNMNWLVSWQTMSTTSQFVVSTVEVRRGVKVNLWQSLLKVCALWTLHNLHDLQRENELVSFLKKSFKIYFKYRFVGWISALSDYFVASFQYFNPISFLFSALSRLVFNLHRIVGVDKANLPTQYRDSEQHYCLESMEFNIHSSV